LNTGDDDDVKAPFSTKMCSPSRLPGIVSTRNGSIAMPGILVPFQ